MTQRNKIKIPVIVVAIMLIILATILVVYVYDTDKKPKNISKPTNADISLQVGLEKSTYYIGEDIVFKSYITNTAREEKSFEFGTTCTEGSIYIDDKPTQEIRSCGQAMTKITIKPKQTINYQYEFILVDNLPEANKTNSIEYEGELKLDPGKHSAKLKWYGYESNSIEFTIL